MSKSMLRLRGLGSFATLTAGLLIAALIAGTALAAVVSNGFFYSPRQTGFYSIHPSALSPTNTPAASNFGIVFNGAQLVIGGSSLLCYSTGVNLPQGAIIQGVAAAYASGPTGTNPMISFAGTRLTDGGIVRLVSFRSIVVNDAQRHVTSYSVPSSSAAVVDNSRYVYSFAFCLGSSNDAFYGARIAYSYNSAGD